MVEMYSIEGCPYCIAAKELLDRKGIKFKLIEIDRSDEKMLSIMRNRTQGRKTFPQIFINDQGIGGYDQLQALEDSQQLSKLLQG